MTHDDPMTAPDAAVAQDDLAAILRAAGLSDAARPYSPHECVQRDLLPAIRRLSADLATARDETFKIARESGLRLRDAFAAGDVSLAALLQVRVALELPRDSHDNIVDAAKSGWQTRTSRQRRSGRYLVRNVRRRPRSAVYRRRGMSASNRDCIIVNVWFAATILAPTGQLTTLCGAVCVLAAFCWCSNLYREWLDEEIKRRSAEREAG